MRRAAILILPVLLLGRAEACCTAFPKGAFVQIASQEMAVVWDEKGGTEHFIRRAAFETRDPAFGFLVPTPTVPELAEAPDALFSRLQKAIEPERVTKRVLSMESVLLAPICLSASRSAGLATDNLVRVLLQQRVAGYDAVVLEADDPKALAGWLKDHGYESRPALEAWLAPYVADRWKITAFKLAVGEPGGDGARYAVRMSFRTDRPVFPFRTPADQSAKGPGNHLLRIFFVGPERVLGNLGGELYGAKIPYARRRSDLGALLGDAVPKGASGGQGWLTVFEDSSWPRAAKGDLYFEADGAFETVPPPVVIKKKVLIPVEVFAVAAIVGLWLWRRRAGA